MKSRPLIIDKPSLQSLRQRYLSATFTFIFWTVWIFLWTPLLTLLGWLMGLDLVYVEMLQLKGYREVVADFGRFLICIAVIGGILGIWAAYNFFRFKDLERRAAIKPVTTPELAAFFGINPQKLTQQQTTQCLSVSFDSLGNIVASQKLEAATRPAD
ncbi:poly-beta-1,6-N-acetyl-D-glucosamine biosynthesis protein PgaD [Methylomonas sp. SURF-2]|uniref:Poly-beta-1,6-N-acetyl-D-glucosamine biosynthesis protein PgaD n=1 Tax=Methylomonas subterranea TaxID=2952225 RepID=A0ABT1TDM8_9GAMM|nr:poly-beta-1,6-N-acetyl-D-glucosamine biosynthesis protein PgaD [Methylomonas sp. SURF-2]MCQ8102874.1 poly-beta-1,6-N-acetyl-D-glucosamine biosynthesis protein PgaD [Methylomonas sp. SURF-2]